MAPGESGNADAGAPRKAPNLVLRRIREQERHETREEFAEAMTRVARELGENVFPDAKYVARLETGDIRYPRPMYRRILSEVCGRPFSDLGFSSSVLSLPAPAGDDSAGLSESNDDAIPAKRSNGALRDAVMASGLELSQIARKVGVDPKSVQRWITRGVVPHPRHRWKTCEILGRHESELWPDAAFSYGNPDERIDLLDASRRGFLQSVRGAAVAAAVSASLYDSLTDLRTRAGTLLDTQSVSSASLDSWDETAEYYGFLELTAEPEIFLGRVAYEFDNVQKLLSQRQPLRVQKRLYRVTGQFAGLIAIVSNDVGWNSQPWFAIASRAAEEAEDNSLAAWALSHQSMTWLWNGDFLKAVRLAQEAQGKSHHSAAGALAAAMEARAQARLGRNTETLAAIKRSDKIFDQLDASNTQVNVLHIYEHLLRFYQSYALTVIDETDEAFKVQERALSLTPGNVVDTSLLQMDHATCLIKKGNHEEGCRVAINTIGSFQPESRDELVIRRAREILSLTPSGAHSSQLRGMLEQRSGG